MRYLTVFLCLIISMLHAQPDRSVYIIHDESTGPEKLTELVRQELNTLGEARFNIDYEIAHSPNLAQLKQADLAISIGVTNSQSLLLMRIPDRPVIIGTVLDRQLQGLPVTSEGTSGVPGLNYIQNPFDMAADLDYLRLLFDFQHLGILVDEEIYSNSSMFSENLFSMFRADESFEFTPVTNEPIDQLAAQLKKKYDALYLLPLGNAISADQMGAFLDSLSFAGIPTFAMLGSSIVETGAMASRTPEQSMLTLARRIALNAINILSGESAADQPVETTSVGSDFVINMEAVRNSGIYPGWQALGQARLIHLEEKVIGSPTNFREVIADALIQNLNYQMSQLETQSGSQEVRLAIAELLPELSVNSSFSAIDEARSAASFGSTQPYTWNVKTELSQILFAEPLLANRRIQQLLQASRVANQRQTEMDVILEVSEAYFNVLLAKSVVRLQNENVNNTRINLNLAKNKEAVGYSGISEVYRWETQLAINKIDLNDAQANEHSARFRLNQILNRPQDENFTLAETELTDSLLFILDSRLFTYLSDPGQLNKLGTFLVAEGKRNLPELAQIRFSLQAQERLLKSRQRAFYLPSLGLNGNAGYNIYQGGYESNSTIPPQVEDILPEPITGVTWNIGVGLNFPIFQGGSRKAENQQATIDLVKLRTQRQDLENQLELRIRTGMQTAGASYAEISLSRKAAESAKKNLAIAQNGYREGMVPIAQLLDAQEASLQTEIMATNAIYTFLRDFLMVERAIGFYYFLATQEEQMDFFIRAEAYFRK